MNEKKDFNEKSSDELRADIAATRAQVAQDVEALGQKLSPENIKQNIKNEARETFNTMKHDAKENIRRRVRSGASAVRYGVSNAGNSFVDSARSNPIPVALIGLGLGWLIWDARRRSTPHVRTLPSYDYNEYGGYDQYDQYGAVGTGYGDYGYSAGGVDEDQYYSQQQGQFSQTEYEGGYDQGPGRGERLREGARNLAGEARSRVQDYGERAREHAQHLRSSARDRAMQLREASRQRAIWARNEARHQMNENPFTLGAVALAAGVGVGLLLPNTEREDRWMGERRDELVRRAKERALEAKEAAAETARRAAEAASQTAKDTARSEAERRGFTSQGKQSSTEQGQTTVANVDVTVREVKSVGDTNWGQNGRTY